ncbi:MAG TPA: CoA transferase [Tepidiformaceae bacterium]|nr:CoA transferase [Tepidiformaceae bacterium]
MATKRLPLEGVRVLDFAVVWAGPFGTMQLGDLGAEVVKVENTHVWQPMARGGMARPNPAIMAMQQPWAGGYPNGGDLKRPWNVSPTFVQIFRNKYSFTVDLQTDEGRKILERLISVCDVFYENNVTETMEKLGISYEYLKSIKPDIIMLRAPAYGSTGPYRNYRALGVHLEGVSGHSMLRHYRDTDPSTNSQIYAGDYFAGTHGAFAVIAALEHRRKTGKGQLIEIGQNETAMGMLAQFVMNYALNQDPSEAIGNRDIHGGVPCGAFKMSGEDRWLALTVYGDEQWLGLADVLGNPAWMAEERFATVDGRKANEDELEKLLAAELLSREVWETTRALQAKGIAAGPIMDAGDAFHNEHVRARGTLVPVKHPDIPGEHLFPGPLWKWSDAPVTIRKAPVTLGEDNDYVYREVMGFSEAEYETFKEHGHIGTEYDPSIA